MTTNIVISLDTANGKEDISVNDDISEEEIIRSAALLFGLIWDSEDDSGVAYEAIAEKISKLVIAVFRDLITLDYAEGDKEYPEFLKVLIESLENEIK